MTNETEEQAKWVLTQLSKCIFMFHNCIEKNEPDLAERALYEMFRILGEMTISLDEMKRLKLS